MAGIIFVAQNVLPKSYINHLIMKTISLKMPDELYEKVEKYRKLENINRTSYVLEALAAYNRSLEREALRSRLQEESKIASKERQKFRAEMDIWDNTIFDGLEDEDWGHEGKI